MKAVAGEVAVVARCDEVVKLRQAHLTYAEIGRRLGISREQARQLAKPKPRPKPAPKKPDLDSKVMLRTVTKEAHSRGYRQGDWVY